jgi:hypothetical protein
VFNGLQASIDQTGASLDGAAAVRRSSAYNALRDLAAGGDARGSEFDRLIEAAKGTADAAASSGPGSGSRANSAAQAASIDPFGMEAALRSGAPRPPAGVDPELWNTAREQAGELVAMTFVQPMLGELRSNSQAWGPFKPGVWEERLGPVLDAEVAKNVVSASSWGLVDKLAAKFVNRPGIDDLRTQVGSQLGSKGVTA